MEYIYDDYIKYLLSILLKNDLPKKKKDVLIHVLYLHISTPYDQSLNVNLYYKPRNKEYVVNGTVITIKEILLKVKGVIIPHLTITYGDVIVINEYPLHYRVSIETFKNEVFYTSEKTAGYWNNRIYYKSGIQFCNYMREHNELDTNGKFPVYKVGNLYQYRGCRYYRDSSGRFVYGFQVSRIPIILDEGNRKIHNVVTFISKLSKIPI